MTLGAAFQRAGGFLRARIRPVRPARAGILKPLGKPVDQALGRECDFSILNARFQQIPDFDMGYIAHMLWNDKRAQGQPTRASRRAQ